MQPNTTYLKAMAAGRAAGNESMRAAGRSEWNPADYAAATNVTAALLRPLTGAELIAARQAYRAAA